MEGEGEEKGMEGVKGQEGRRGGLDEVREGTKGLVAEGEGEMRNEAHKIGTKRGGDARGAGSCSEEGRGDHRSESAWGGGAAPPPTAQLPGLRTSDSRHYVYVY